MILPYFFIQNISFFQKLYYISYITINCNMNTGTLGAAGGGVSLIV